MHTAGRRGRVLTPRTRNKTKLSVKQVDTRTGRIATYEFKRGEEHVGTLAILSNGSIVLSGYIQGINPSAIEISGLGESEGLCLNMTNVRLQEMRIGGKP